MVDVEIKIKKDSIYSDVYTITGHTAKALDDMDKISATEDEENVLDPFLVESTAKLGEIISSYGVVSDVTDTISIRFSLPPNWKAEAKPALEMAIHNYIVNSINIRWFAMNNRTDVEYYNNKIASSAQNIIKLLCEKTKPKRN